MELGNAAMQRQQGLGGIAQLADVKPAPEPAINAQLDRFRRLNERTDILVQRVLNIADRLEGQPPATAGARPTSPTHAPGLMGVMSDIADTHGELNEILEKTIERITALI